jgi:hypothetical protein
MNDERMTQERAKYHQESLKIAKFVLYESGFERLDGFGNFVVFCTAFVPQITQTIDN